MSYLTDSTGKSQFAILPFICMKIPRHLIGIALIVFLIYLTIHVVLLSQYGLNWDEPIHYMRGQIFLRFFLTGKKDYQDLPKLRIHFPKNDFTPMPPSVDYEDDSQFRRSIYQYDQEPYKLTYTYFVTDDNEAGHPPLSDIIAALFNMVFYQKFGWLGDIESYHLFIVFVSSLLVASVFLFTATLYGIFSGVVAALVLTLYPLFFAEQHFNIKDPVETVFYSLTLMSFFWAVTRKNQKFLIASSLFFGLALSTKFNILFALLTMLPWTLVYNWRKVRSLRIGFLLYPCIAASMLFATWPYLWDDPIGKLGRVIGFYRTIGATQYQVTTLTIFGINTYALQWILFSTPLVALALFCIGLYYTFVHARHEKHKSTFFILLWLLVPVLRVSMPGAGIYGGLRQIMEFIPALAILSGIGAMYLARKRWFLQLVVILSFIPIALKIISIHPNQNVYMNPLTGGLKGAKERDFPDWGVTLGSVYQQGMDWLNENAEPNANISLVRGLLSNIPRIKIRQDLNFGHAYWSGEKKEGEYLLELIDYYWIRDIPLEKRTYLETLVPVYEVNVDSVSILTIWKNDKEHSRGISR